MPSYTDEQRKRLNAALRTLKELAKIVRGVRERGNVHHWGTMAGPANALRNEMQELQRLFPELELPEFQPEAGTETEAYIARALPRLEVVLEETQLPVEKLEFAFVRNEEVRRIIERDYQEIQSAFLVKCWKSVIILTGGAIEAILLDLLLGREDEAKSANAAPERKELLRWDLSELIEVAVELELIEPIAKNLQHTVRLYRNLVHPGNELKNHLTPERLEAESGLIVLRTIHRDLSRRS